MSRTERILFRFSFSFFLLFIFFTPNAVENIDLAYPKYIELFHRLIPWIGKHILHLSKPITAFTGGSGDTTYDYVILLLNFVLSVVACTIWTALDRKRLSYDMLLYWLTTTLRIYLAFTMLSYGLAKVFKLQFPYPSLTRLLEPYGDSSPMGLAWTYMGYSTGYNLFTGLAEVIAGILLLFRRTTAIGAFLSFIVSVNIMAMNYSYDICVKIMSTAMVVMSLFLLGDNIRRLWNLFFRGEATVLRVVVHKPVIRKKAVRITLIGAKYGLIAWFLFVSFKELIDYLPQYSDDHPRNQLYGIYNTRSFVYRNDTLAALQTDSIRWKQIAIDGSPDDVYGQLKMMDDSTRRYGMKLDTIARLLTITDNKDSAKNWRLHYNWPVKDTLFLFGIRNWSKSHDSIRITMTAYPLNGFRLVSRKFNWINEYPYNR
jgi:uncharacterized membrane protein YphA (DoxX/SURF4 family)